MKFRMKYMFILHTAHHMRQQSLQRRPVIGVPLKSAALDGVDALLATCMMPSGIPVATVAIDGAKNAAYLAAEILAVGDEALAKKISDDREKMHDDVIAKNEEVAKKFAK